MPPELVLSKLVMLPRQEVVFIAAAPASDKLVALFILIEGQCVAKSAKSSMLTIVVPDVWWTSSCFSSDSDDNADDMDMVKSRSKNIIGLEYLNVYITMAEFKNITCLAISTSSL